MCEQLTLSHPARPQSSPPAWSPCPHPVAPPVTSCGVPPPKLAISLPSILPSRARLVHGSNPKPSRPVPSASRARPWSLKFVTHRPVGHRPKSSQPPCLVSLDENPTPKGNFTYHHGQTCTISLPILSTLPGKIWRTLRSVDRRLILPLSLGLRVCARHEQGGFWGFATQHVASA